MREDQVENALEIRDSGGGLVAWIDSRGDYHRSPETEEIGGRHSPEIPERLDHIREELESLTPEERRVIINYYSEIDEDGGPK